LLTDPLSRSPGGGKYQLLGAGAPCSQTRWKKRSGCVLFVAAVVARSLRTASGLYLKVGCSAVGLPSLRVCSLVWLTRMVWRSWSLGCCCELWNVKCGQSCPWWWSERSYLNIKSSKFRRRRMDKVGGAGCSVGLDDMG
jgi:hypothetical protein